MRSVREKQAVSHHAHQMRVEKVESEWEIWTPLRCPKVRISRTKHDFASAATESAAEHMSAFAEVAKKLQMETVDLLMAAGKDLADDAQKTAEKASKQAQDAVKKAAAAAKA